MGNNAICRSKDKKILNNESTPKKKKPQSTPRKRNARKTEQLIFN